MQKKRGDLLTSMYPHAILLIQGKLLTFAVKTKKNSLKHLDIIGFQAFIICQKIVV